MLKQLNQPLLSNNIGNFPQRFTAVNQSQAWDSMRKKFLHGPKEFQNFRNHFSPSLNYICVFLNALTALNSNIKFLPNTITKLCEASAENFARYSIPASYTWNSLEALMGNRAIESIVRFLPALSFFVLPFHNFNIATGISSGLNNLNDLITERLGGKQPSESVSQNVNAVLKEGQQLVKEFFTTIKPLKPAANEVGMLDQFSTISTITGGCGGLLFAAQDRNSLPAKFFGSFGNIGGFLLDISMAFSKNARKRVIGLSCGLASLSNILMRFVNKKLSKFLNHVSIAADTFGMTYWAQSSKEINDLVINRS